jgi:hypothetical protein
MSIAAADIMGKAEGGWNVRRVDTGTTGPVEASSERASSRAGAGRKCRSLGRTADTTTTPAVARVEEDKEGGAAAEEAVGPGAAAAGAVFFTSEN